MLFCRVRSFIKGVRSTRGPGPEMAPGFRGSVVSRQALAAELVQQSRRAGPGPVGQRRMMGL